MIDLVIEQRRRDLGGFEVGRVLPYAKRRMVGPFIFLDHIGPVDFPPGIPQSVDVRPHPHIGLASSAAPSQGDTTNARPDVLDRAARGTIAARAGSGAVAGGGIATGSDTSHVAGAANAIAGGVGLNARARLSGEAAPDHNVKMVFSLNTGNYLAGVHVKVTDKSGNTVIDGAADGPWLYAKLQPGTYTATATYAGYEVTERFTVGRAGQRVAYFRWPATVEQHLAQTAGMSPILGTGPQEESR